MRRQRLTGRLEIDHLLAEYRHEAIAEHMVEVNGEAANLTQYCLPYAVACRVADIDVELDDEIDLHELNPPEDSAPPIHELHLGRGHAHSALAEDEGEERTLADEIDEDIAVQARLLRLHLSELRDAAGEAVYAASRGDVLLAIHHAREADSSLRAAAAAHESWFESAGAMRNVDTGRLGPVGEEIDMFMGWPRTMK